MRNNKFKISDIKDMIGEDEVPKVFEFLKENQDLCVSKESKNEYLLIKSQYKDLKKRSILGLSNTTENQKIKLQLVEFLDLLSEENENKQVLFDVPRELEDKKKTYMPLTFKIGILGITLTILLTIQLGLPLYFLLIIILVVTFLYFWES